MSKIKDLLVNLDDEALLEEVKKQLDEGVEPAAIIDECQAAMVEIGNLFSDGEMFVSDLMMAGAMFKSVSELVIPLMTEDAGKSAGKVVLG
ncbi:MAG TPA: B12-binding domain-containing protein, partial [Anaerovoracaceae bacterium]|nr:B12-binding domain-containing protein [Anaerovoracaceae bacterium]